MAANIYAIVAARGLLVLSPYLIFPFSILHIKLKFQMDQIIERMYSHKKANLIAIDKLPRYVQQSSILTGKHFALLQC
jgi:hypothetical protein